MRALVCIVALAVASACSRTEPAPSSQPATALSVAEAIATPWETEVAPSTTSEHADQLRAATAMSTGSLGYPNARGPEAAMGTLEIVRGLLKPDGILGLVDHSGNPGPQNHMLHRVEEAKVIEVLEASGFVVEATSDVLRHPEDDRTRFVFDREMRGKTDRFVLRVRRTD